MLYPGLEKLIQKGKAEYHTASIGASGIGTIPCPDGSFVIVTDFDYFPFLDVPFSQPPLPAIGTITLQQSNALTQTIQFTFGGFPPLTVPGVVFGNQGATQLAVDTAIGLDVNFIGWSCAVLITPDPFIPNSVYAQFQFTTPTPGTIYNGTLMGFVNLSAPPDPNIVFNTAFFLGQDAITPTVQEIIDRAIHQVEFKSTKGRNHYIFADDLELGIALGLDLNLATLINVRGMYHRDCYLVHTSDVQIDITTVPPVSAWSVNYSNPPAKSQEFPAPSGYGQGAVGFPAVREVVFDSAGPTQQYYPLTQFRDDLPVIAGQNRNEFKVDVNTLNKLNNPTVLGLPPFTLFNGRNYPILNIGYVLIKMNYNQFVSSNG